MTDTNSTAHTVDTARTDSSASESAEAVVGQIPRGATLGRYVVLDLLGAGGMGVVHTAYDPELDRKVALKLLRTDHAVGRARLLREAQALARLAHPNVVAVHDVGATEQHVFIAMEFIHGVTLARHLEAHTLAWPEVLELFVAVGRGLAAAHAAGLVHRDLKPDNVMVGGDGRVRVLDFGLARASLARSDAGEESPTASALDVSLTHPGKLLGTPKYMAPEQWLAVAVDARTDQFALCVMLWQALFGEPPFAGDSVPALMRNVVEGRLSAPSRPARAPTWLRRVLERGLAVEPAARFPTVATLLAALAEGQARGRRRRLLGGLLVVGGLVGAGFGGQSLARARTRASCEALGAGVAVHWNDGARASLRAALVGTGLDYAATSFDRLVPWIDRWTAEWARARTDVCVAAEVEDDLSPALYVRASACLDERLEALPALLAALHQADAAAVAQAVPAAASLPALTPCSDAATLARSPALPEEPGSHAQVGAVRRDLMRARGLAAAGHAIQGLEAAGSALAAIDPQVQPALAAEAQLLVGDLEHRTGALAAAEGSLTRAFEAASQLGADELAATAAIGLTRVVGHGSPRHAEGLLWARVAAPLVRRLDHDDGLLGADLRDARALVEQARGAYSEAMALHEEVLRIRQRELGPEHPAVARTLVNQAILHGLLGAYDREAALFEQALVVSERALGPDHPEVARILHNLAIGLSMRGELERALALQVRALTLWQRAHPPEHPDVVAAMMNLGRIHQARGDLDQALALGEQALVVSERALGPDHPEFAMALNNVATMYWDREDYDKVQALLARSLAIQEKALGPDHPDLVLPLVNLASVHKLRGALGEATALLRRALAIQERALGPDHPSLAHPLLGLAGVAMAEHHPADAVPLLERAASLRDRPDSPPELRGEARSRLARALWDRAGAGDRTRARDLAAAALTDLRAGGESMAEDIAELEAWVAVVERSCPSGNCGKSR